MPKKGFLNFTRREYAPLSLAKLQQWIAQGRIDTAIPITVGTVVRSNLIHGIKGWSGVKLLGQADPNLPLPPLEIELSRFSKSAADAVINAGGSVTAVYHNQLGLRQEIWPEKFAGREVRNAAPIRRTDIGECLAASSSLRPKLTQYRVLHQPEKARIPRKVPRVQPPPRQDVPSGEACRGGRVRVQVDYISYCMHFSRIAGWFSGANAYRIRLRGREVASVASVALG